MAKSIFYKVRITPADKLLWEAYAEYAEQTVSEFIRGRCGVPPEGYQPPVGTTSNMPFLFEEVDEEKPVGTEEIGVVEQSVPTGIGVVDDDAMAEVR